MIKGKRITLRLMEREDIRNITRLRNDYEQMGEFWPVVFLPERQAEKRYEDNGCWSEQSGTMLVLNEEKAIIGEIVYFKGVWYMPGYEIGYRLFRDEHRGKGYMTEALELFSKYLFEVYDIKRLEVCADYVNEGSKRVAEKCGYKYEGRKRAAAYCRGKYWDVDLYSMTRDDL